MHGGTGSLRVRFTDALWLVIHRSLRVGSARLHAGRFAKLRPTKSANAQATASILRAAVDLTRAAGTQFAIVLRLFITGRFVAL